MDKMRFTGSQIKAPEFETVYRTLEEAVKIKLESEIKNFLESPIFEIKEKSTIFSVCADPRRKCIIAFLDPTKCTD